MDFSLIPFGLNVSDGEFMDVHDVPRGAKCGCICPSCKTPLIARQGNEKEWHFAHASRSVYEKTENECEFSFYVSVRMMARQIIGDELEVLLPEYRDSVSKYNHRTGRSILENFTVTDSKKIQLSGIEVERTFLGVPVDIVGQVGGFKFVIYFTHPGRDVPVELISPTDTQCGIVAVALNTLPIKFRAERKSGSSYQTTLLEHLSDDVTSKQWVFHPRYDRCREKAKQALEEKSSRLKPVIKSHQRSVKYPVRSQLPDITTSIESFVPEKKRLALFECVMCRSQWQDWEPGGSECPKCRTHLYRVCKEFIGV